LWQILNLETHIGSKCMKECFLSSLAFGPSAPSVNTKDCRSYYLEGNKSENKKVDRSNINMGHHTIAVHQSKIRMSRVDSNGWYLETQ
jgi:hypothetical protein